ncbi:unnamed protein product [Peronospora effusa]|nr:unnamed protein product [Peronospora effusa]
MHHDDDDDVNIMLPVPVTPNGVEPMTVDQTGNDQIVSPLSEFESLTLRQDYMHASDPAFDIDDIYMEPTDLDVDTNHDIVPRRDTSNFDECSVMQSSQFGGQNAPLALSPSIQGSQALVPMEMSNAIVSTRRDEQVERASKRNCIEYEQANVALETPSTYQDAMASSQAKMWCDVIKTE